jgi:hypothetical protein
LKLTLDAAEALIRGLVFSGRSVDFFITGSLAYGHTFGSEPQNIDFVCLKYQLADQLSFWKESAYFGGSSYKKEILPGITANAIAVSSLSEFEAWSIATKAFKHRAGTTWPSKLDRLTAFGHVLIAAKQVLCK